MKIIPREWVLLVEKLVNSQLKHDMVLEEDEADKRLIVGRVLSDWGFYKKWTLIVFGKYSIFKLTYKWNDYSFIEEWDVVSVIK